MVALVETRRIDQKQCHRLSGKRLEEGWHRAKGPQNERGPLRIRL
jgi:hypothetical protein